MGLLGRDADRNELRRIVTDWHGMALPFIRTKPFDETWTDFIIAWGKIKRPAGQSLAAALAAADVAPAPEAANKYRSPTLRRLVALCARLAAQWGSKPFPLGCVKAGECIGFSKSEAHRLLKTLEFDGIIQLATKGSKASGRASEWRYLGGER